MRWRASSSGWARMPHHCRLTATPGNRREARVGGVVRGVGVSEGASVGQRGGGERALVGLWWE